MKIYNKENLLKYAGQQLDIDKKSGEIIYSNDIKRIRPGNGLAPKFQEKIIGLKLKKDVQRGEPVSWDKFE